MDEKREAEGVRELGIIAVILTGLKIIGLILLALLIVLLVITALLLFVPFVYRIRVKYIAEKLSLQGEISFLFKLLYARVLYDNELSYGLKVAFYTLASSEEKPEKKKTKPKQEARIKEKTKEEDKEENTVDEQTKNEQKESEAAKVKTERASEEKPESDNKEEAAPEKKIEADIKKEAVSEKECELDNKEDAILDKKTEPNKEEAKTEKKSEVNKESASEEKILPDEKKEKKTVKKKIEKTKKKFNIISKLKQIAEKIKAKWKAFKDRFKSLNIKKDAIIRFLNADGTLSGAGYLLAQGKRLLKMIFPKKIEGWLRFGTGDVYTEGQYLSYLCLLYPLYGRKFEIRPEWDEEVFETDAAFSGRITMFIVLLVALKVLFNKKVKLLRNNYNRCKKSMENS